MKNCIKCGSVKNILEFTKNKICKDGYENVCKVCNKKRKHNYYLNNKELYRNYHRNRRAYKCNKNNKVTNNIIKELLLFQDYKCLYCNCDITNGYHLDHIIPLSKNGDNSINNLCISCATCNLRKGSKLFWEFLLILHDEKYL